MWTASGEAKHRYNYYYLNINSTIMNISTTQALAILDKGLAKAAEIKVLVNIAVLDTTGHLKGFIGMDNAFLATIDIAIGKAKTSMLYNLPSHEVGEFLKPESKMYGITATNGGLLGFKGGVPIRDGDRIIGFIGVSGGTQEQDFEVATAAIIF